MSRKTRKLFTPAEANRTLPLVRRIVRDILAKGEEIRVLLRATEKPGEELDGLQHELDELLTELEHIGCTFKDWNFQTGLVDFPSEIDGRPVLLCWRSDEKRVTWYHTYDAGYAGRTRIPARLLEE